ncbi:hypothetical protein GTP23_06665 [Pseudoduganella sp. FT93W]|uniref:Phosphate ABC transporter substrate-binding protein n=1 Tax=Duganella fentianensis TaxID=2692177 RepID=A0A845HTI8_9BURK|nr:hypothetical protein [Duganella fentianensis]MYN44754.1 hypothetical protein [Duganella fentianensis]
MQKFVYSCVYAALLGFVVPAYAEVVVIAHPSAPEATLSKDEVAQCFLGKSSAFTPVDQLENAAIRAEFYRKVADKDQAQVRALWAKLVFTGKGTMPKELGGNAEVKRAVAANPKTIGYIDKSAVDATVKVIYTLP